MIPSIIFEARSILSHEIDYCEDYFPVSEKCDDEQNDTQDDTGLILGCQALLVL